MQAGIPNRNKRIYPVPTLQKEVNRYVTENVAKNRAYGELNHPSGPNINGDRIAILIKELRQDGNDFKGKALVASTPMGDIVRGLLKDGASLGVSSRALGTLKPLKSQNEELSEVQDDLRLLAVDVVTDPSAPAAFVNGIMENHEYYYNPKTGIYAEQTKKIIKKASKNQLTESFKLKLFENFIRQVKN